MKRGFATPGAEQYTGRVHVLDIGAPRRLVEEVIGLTESHFRRDSAKARSNSWTLRSN